MSQGATVERKFLKNGKPNPKYIDLCEEDAPIAGQKFACISFVSPEKILKQREMFLFERFVQNWDMTKSMEKMTGFLNFVSYKYNLDVETIMKDFQDFITEEEPQIKKESAILDDYKNFLDKHEEKLTQEFNKNNQFQTSVRGLKLRGSFPTQEEAEIHCKKLREKDPHFDIYVGPVGVWIPVDIDCYKTQRVEHLEPELNRLFEEKIKNETYAKNEFEERVKNAKRKAIEDNIQKAKQSGNKLTQTIDEEGNLVGVNTMNFDDREAADEEEKKKYHSDLFVEKNI